MTASLVVAGFEMIGPTTNPEYRLAPGFDFGAGEPDQTTITSLYLDGDTVSGERTRNRNIQLPITVRGANPQTIAANMSTLLQAVSEQTFTVQWTPDGGLPVLFDCYRAVWNRPNRSLVLDAAGLSSLVLQFQAAPFGRSPDLQTVTAAAAQTQIDSFDTAATGGTLDTTTKYEGTGSNKVTLVSVGSGNYSHATPISRTFAAKNLSADTVATIRVNIGASRVFQTHATVALTLGSAGGSTRFLGAVDQATLAWGLVSIPLTGGTVVSGTGVSLAAVTSHAVTVTATSAGFPVTGGVPSTAYVDDLRGVPPSSTAITTSKGAVLLVPGVVGDARTPVNLAATRTGGGTFGGSAVLHSPPSVQDPDVAILLGLNTSLADQTVSVPAAQSRYAGTYLIVLAIDTNGAAGTNSVDVTFTQSGGSTTKTVTKAYTSPLTGGLVVVGQVTLPLRAVPPDNTSTTFTVRVNRTAGADLYSDLMLCDTRGQTVTVTSTPTAMAALYVDAPDPTVSLGRILMAASGGDRTTAFSVSDGVGVATGGPMSFDPGGNKILAMSPAGALTITATYPPRWLDERTV